MRHAAGACRAASSLSPATTGRPVGFADMRVDAIYGAIGRFSVRFRWLVLLIWIAAAIAAATQLPALSSVTQGNNQKFLPASALAHPGDQEKASGNTGNKVQLLSVLFVIVLLVLIFRSLTLAIVTVLPPVLSVRIAGPLVAEAAKHGLQVSPIAQLLLIVLV